ncbi:phage regulatory protein/antirepressor Ant [Pseudomonas gregormendelii]|uniref:Phage regulatory protein/antirepressor Ant n=1 Tax=Pseudomonas gregormendelii TaxID=1628277 RepID=A0ABS3AGK2_9PSED|nr:phage regulatory protein/antirepressor Ant [Pseudomonas gregormendelii]MBN3966289.1 phage regulatory protein/antirepressor Ant [Pseudomonas gregormendelii]
MSSREIAELTGKQHKHVKVDVEKMLTDLQEDAPSFRRIYLDSMNREQTEYLLDREHTDCLLTGYNARLRMAVVRRWRELEQDVGAVIIPTTLPEALRLAADQAEENLRLIGMIELQAPKVSAIKRLAAAGGAICITDAAKHLQIKPSMLFAWLEQHRWIFRRQGSGRWTAYQPRITSGYLIHKVTSLKADPQTGVERAAFDPLVTPKGLAHLAEINIGASL